MKKTNLKSELVQPVPIGTPGTVKIRELLEKSGYVAITSKAIAKALQGSSVCFQCNRNKPLTTLLHLFYMGKPVSQVMAQSVLQAVNIDALLEAGLIEIKDGQVTSLVRFFPYRDLLLISDFKWASASDSVSHRQSVMGVTGSTEFLANVTVRKPSRLTLDLGTGTGVQALLAARHSEKVISVDLNSRALAFAQFNAQLNGFTNIEFIEGDLFKPVEGQSFDLIVSNPPFLISPESQCLYRDNPLDGDKFVQGIVREMPRFLTQGGFGQVVCNWIQPGNDNWMNRLNKWYKDSGCDGWVIRQSETEPVEYAQTWLEGFKTKDIEQRQKTWLNYYQQNDITAVGFGLITLRRNSKSSHWSRIDKTLPEITQNSGSYINHIFQVQDFLNQTQKDNDLLNQQFRVCPYLRIDKQSAPAPGGSWTIISARLVLTQGLLHQLNVNSPIMEIVIFCKPHMTLGKLLNKIAVRQKKAPDEFITTHLPACRRLIELGFLWPANIVTEDLKDDDPISESKNTEFNDLHNTENQLLSKELASSSQSSIS